MAELFNLYSVQPISSVEYEIIFWRVGIKKVKKEVYLL